MTQKIAIILARSGSKGIPKKNLTKIKEHSLLGYAILSALGSEVFDRVIVSTDGQEIAQEAQKYGAEVIMRPVDLASDNASSISGVVHALDNLNIEKGTVCLLQATSPLRTAKHIQEAYKMWSIQNQGCVVSACESEHHPYKFLIETNNEYLPIHDLRDLESPRQKLSKAYRPNGAIYFNRIEEIMEKQRFFISPINLYIMSEEDSVDIDTMNDIQRAEQILEKRMSHQDSSVSV
ncbi:acylneuraminate cytidylyltransferase family protein [Basilea psittacipulmonis]|uniref:Acylneuraminate cytidylyltransferase n=1 Tax=Basilea psittacipulmonis DSM 24701 TaxID=1072685 RepID=A0A077DEC4_9BURK|nr:NTP transferase domain-containing protein [Basilea psittacipulmonis]AIL33064.1 acylneuraminate cytidylyltransferase [Basilea psittacipulmonis DSM 24701]